MMDLSAAHRRNDRVRHFEIKDVVEPVPWSDGAVGQFHQPCRRDQMMASCQLLAMTLYPLSRFLQAGGKRDG